MKGSGTGIVGLIANPDEYKAKHLIIQLLVAFKSVIKAAEVKIDTD